MKKVMMGLMVLSLFVAVGCSKATVDEQTDVPKEAAMTDVGKSISVASVTIGDTTWSPIEVAVTEDERIQGLGGRDSLAANTGMLFIFPREPGQVTDPFWMKDTKFNLDMIFVNQDKQVVTVALDNPAESLELIEPTAPYLYVLEVNAGEAKDVKVGDEMTMAMP